MIDRNMHDDVAKRAIIAQSTAMDAMHAGASGPETLAETVAARLRGYLAERRISHKDFGEIVGWDRGKYQRRLSGDVALDLADLEDIEARMGLTVTFLITGVGDMPPKPPVIHSMSAQSERRVIPLRPTDSRTTNESGFTEHGVSDDAEWYVAVAEGSTRRSRGRTSDDQCPHQDSNLGPADYETYCHTITFGKSAA